MDSLGEIGRYELLALLGEGSSSEVFLARDPLDGAQVAIKLYRQDMLRDPQHARLLRQQLLTEATLARRLKHPHIARILDVVLGEAATYMVLEYIPGGSLEAFSEPATLMAPERLLEILFKCTQALDFAFRRGITHRDIKPANIMLMDAAGTRVKISDFGAALSPDLRQTVILGLGSPAYMSPEQVREESLNHQTDIYSLGAVMYQLLTGQFPFAATNHTSLAWQIVNTTPPPPSSLRPALPTCLDEVVARAMHRQRERRYASWQEFAHDLNQAARELRQPLSQEVPPEAQRFQAMRAMPFFRQFDDAEIWEALHLSQWRAYQAGALVMREGEPGDRFALLVDGQVSVCSQGRALHRLAPGECVGEMAVVTPDQGVRSADVIADSDCHLLEIAAPALSHASAGCQLRFYRAFMDTLATRLAQANERLLKT